MQNPDLLSYVLKNKPKTFVRMHINKTAPAYGVTALIATSMAQEGVAEKMAKLLISKGADVNVPDSGPGATPLFMAAQEGKVGLTKLLLSHGARFDVHPFNTKTLPIAIAAQNGHAEVIALILRAAEQANMRKVVTESPNKEGRTPLYVSVERANPKVAGALLASGMFILLPSLIRQFLALTTMLLPLCLLIS